MDLKKLWARIEADLELARKTLPRESDNDSFIDQYKEFLDNNELELACDMLEAYGENNPVKAEFWRSLRDAASKMQLSDRVHKYERWMRMSGK